MVPLSYFLVAWVAFLAIYGILVFVTLIQMLRHGLPSVGAYITTFFFLLITAGTVIWTVLYFTTVDWNIQIDLTPRMILPFFGINT
jgi:hypothetical protein